MGTITAGVDLAKNVFSACEVDEAGRVLRRHDLKRDAFVVWLAQLPAGTVVAYRPAAARTTGRDGVPDSASFRGSWRRSS